MRISRDKLSSWCWRGNMNKNYLMMFLLVNANFKSERFEKIIVERGQYIFSYDGLSRDCGMPLQTLRTTLKDLVETNQIAIKSTRKWSLLTICEYDSWQNQDDETNTKVVTQTGTQVVTQMDNNIINKEINNKDIKEEDTNVSKKKSTDYPSDFESDWTLYDRKGSKKDSYEQWKKLTDEDKEKMRRHIPHYFQSNDRQYLKDFERYIKHRTFESPVYRQAKMLFDPQIIENHINGEYDPSGWLNYDDTFDAFRYFGREPKYDLRDGYTDDNRPDGARVVTQSTVYVWSSATKTWSITR